MRYSKQSIKIGCFLLCTVSIPLAALCHETGKPHVHSTSIQAGLLSANEAPAAKADRPNKQDVEWQTQTNAGTARTSQDRATSTNPSDIEQTKNRGQVGLPPRDKDKPSRTKQPTKAGQDVDADGRAVAPKASPLPAEDEENPWSSASGSSEKQKAPQTPRETEPRKDRPLGTRLQLKETGASETPQSPERGKALIAGTPSPGPTVSPTKPNDPIALEASSDVAGQPKPSGAVPARTPTQTQDPTETPRHPVDPTPPTEPAPTWTPKPSSFTSPRAEAPRHTSQQQASNATVDQQFEWRGLVIYPNGSVPNDIAEEFSRNFSKLILRKAGETGQRSVKRTADEGAVDVASLTLDEFARIVALGSKLTKADAARSAGDLADIPLKQGFVKLGKSPLELLIINVTHHRQPASDAANGSATDGSAAAKQPTCSCKCGPGCTCVCRDAKKDDYFCFCFLNPGEFPTLGTHDDSVPPFTLPSKFGCRVVVLTFGQTEETLPKFGEELRKAVGDKQFLEGTQPVKVVRY
ncbi:Cell surface glycoprotein 1 precursor (Outer layer protein B) (S-layer protein 1) [Candidatus Sumerlaea chitinivorans]|uniref:Cell surface glycoprotein 1 (Outer layer protein B) (S-layer protein 1) n=1 Tax=Sumerlaea chitinivorans TaxID=2250252 RepID=A0A2Z4Y978_SUMC1|nr:Cell surface glycoprotein 1 precursor (Outer layer protein B) (S-layer protein 1) [Candidatus Sumerlaea chitinivorans]